MTLSLSGALTTLLAARKQPTLAFAFHFDGPGLRYVNKPQSVSFGGATYSPAVVEVRELAENFTAEVNAAEVEIADLAGDVRELFLLDEFRGTDLAVSILYRSGGAWVDTTWSCTLTCDSARATASAVVIRLASGDAVQGTECPRRTTQEAGCQFDFKRGACSYRGSRTTCDKGYGTPDGCREHFENVTIDGAAHIQPKPFGGFLGGMVQRVVLR